MTLETAYAASDYAKDGATFAEWLHDETYVCEICETRHSDWSKFASNMNRYAYHSLVCDDCAEGMDAAAYHRETI